MRDDVGTVRLKTGYSYTVSNYLYRKTGLTQATRPADDPRRRRPDISLARQKLGWQPQVGLKEGLEKTVAYFEGVLAG